MKKLLTLLVLIILFSASCKTTEFDIPEDLSEGEYFLEAQKASSDQYDYQKALKYYFTYIERYPESIQLVVEAEYEIAFIYYKMDEYDTAIKCFNQVIERYNTQDAPLLPAWPKILSKKLVEKIQAELNDKDEKEKQEEAVTTTDKVEKDQVDETTTEQ